MLKKLACLLAIVAMLGIVSTADAGRHWRGPGWGGDGTSFNDVLNWDDEIPAAGQGWDAGQSGEQGYGSAQDIHITTASATGSGNGSIGSNDGADIDFTVEADYYNSGYLSYNASGQMTVESGAFYDMRYGQLSLENGNLYVDIQTDGYLYCSTLRHNNGAHMDVSGLLEVWYVSRIAGEGTYYLNVYDGAEMVVHTTPTSGVSGWEDEGGKVTMFVGSTVTIAGDVTGYVSQLVQAGEPGTIEASYDGWTTITMTPEPATALFLLLGLPFLRRRRA